MLETLISSKTRIKLLLKFFLNSNTTAYLRSLETEFGDSTNSIRLELNRLEKAGMLKSFSNGNKKMFQANTNHPLYNEVNSILLKYIGFDTIIEKVVNRLGHVKKVFVTGEFAKGNNHELIDLVFIGEIDKVFLLELLEKSENLINRKIRYVIYSLSEWLSRNLGNDQEKFLLLWESDEL